MHGLSCYLKSAFPKEAFYFAYNIENQHISCLGKFKKWKSSNGKFYSENRVKNLHIEEILEIVEKNKIIYIVFQIPESEHKTLVTLRKKEGGLTLSLFDSLGINPWKRIKGDEPFHYHIKDIEKFFFTYCENLEAIDITRQLDLVNCAIFVISDIFTIKNLLDQGEELFSTPTTPHSAFYTISQQPHHLELTNPLFHRIKNTNISEAVNVKATFIALEVFRFYLKAWVQYPEKHTCQDEVSERDEEGCILM